MNPQQLFDYVLVVSLKNEGGTPKPYVEYRFPPERATKDTLADTIVQFCFPEAEAWINKKYLSEKKKTESFSFVLTESGGERRFGYCRRLVAKDKDGNLSPECFCIISNLPSTPLFTKLLDVIEELRQKSSSAVFSFLKIVLAKNFPSPGEVLTIRTFQGEIYEIKRPDNDYALDSVSFQTLFKSLDVGTVLDLFAALVTESRIVLCSKHVSTLSASVLALSALCYPFNWQHIYIPILPKALMSYCCAPMPFLVGVLSSNLNELNTYPLEEIVLLDLDSGKYLKEVPATCNREILPPFHKTIVGNVTHAIKSMNKNSRKGDFVVAAAFLEFFYRCFEGYEDHFENHVFDRDKFLSSRTPETKQFFVSFSASQMYEMFIKEQEKLSREGKLHLGVLTKKKFTDIQINTTERITSGQISDQVESRRCHKCDKLLPDNTEFIEKKEKKKIYCPDCWEKKKKKMNLDKIKSVSLSNMKKMGNKLSEALSPSSSNEPKAMPKPAIPKERLLSSEGKKSSTSFMSYFKNKKENAGSQSAVFSPNQLPAANIKRPGSLNDEILDSPSSVEKEKEKQTGATSPPPQRLFLDNQGGFQRRPVSLTAAALNKQESSIPPKPFKPASLRSSPVGNRPASLTAAPIRVTNKFCINCGSSMNDGKCQDCDKPKAPKFCVNCGTPLSNGPICPKCFPKS